MLFPITHGCTSTGELTSAGDFEIVGGKGAHIADYPWQVSVQSASGQHTCGGSVLSAEWILTAQHCTAGQTAASMRVAAGISDLSQASSAGQIRGVSEIVPYPGYIDPYQGKDISLLRLSAPLTLDGGVAPIALMTETDAAAGRTDPGVVATATGWGALSSSGSYPDRLQTVQVPLIATADAQAAYSDVTITADQLGAGYLDLGGKDACQGDSGGPLVVPSGAGVKLAGVVSWGYGCADARYPGMYARVSSFASWISSTMNGGAPPPSGAELASGQLIRNLGASSGGWVHYLVQVPAGASSLTAALSGGTGDADLYVKRGSQPTTTSHDCRPYLAGNSETCTLPMPSAGTYYVSLRAYASFSDVSLRVDYDTGDSPGPELDRANLSGSAGSWTDYTLAVPASATTLVVQISGGTGDADLYVRKGSQPTTSSHDCRPYLAGNSETCSFSSGVGGASWYIGLRGYSSYSDVRLLVDYEQ